MMKTMNNILKLSLLSLLIFNGQCVDAVTVKKSALFEKLPSSSHLIQNYKFKDSCIIIYKTIALYPNESKKAHKPNKSIITYTTLLTDSQVVRTLSLYNNKIIYSKKLPSNNPEEFKATSPNQVIEQLSSRGIEL